MHYDLDLATQYFQRLFPNKIDEVTAVNFEYSPGRGNAKYLDDHSAFDVFLEFKRNKLKGFIGIEVKYAESLKEETKDKAKKNYKDRYAELTMNSGLFKENSIENLKQPPLSDLA